MFGRNRICGSHDTICPYDTVMKFCDSMGEYTLPACICQVKNPVLPSWIQTAPFGYKFANKLLDGCRGKPGASSKQNNRKGDTHDAKAPQI